MYQVLMVLHVFITLGLIVMILIQRSDSDGLGGLGGGGNSMSGFMTGKSTANLLTRTTAILATLFILNSLALGIIVSQNRSKGTIAERIVQEQTVPADATKSTPITPSVPKPDADKTSVPTGTITPTKPALDGKPQAAPAVPKPE